MVIEPKILNKTNTVYGTKSLSQSEWRRLVGKALGPFWSGDCDIRGIKDLFDAGKYEEVVTIGRTFLKEISSVQDLENMNEAELAVFYYLGLAYDRVGETEKAIACLHVVLSQNRFVSSLMIGFSHFIDAAYHELKRFAKQYGEEFVNGVDVVSFLQNQEQ